MENRKGRDRSKIWIGRLGIDPVFLFIFLFFMLSSLFLFAFLLISAR